ncbi:MAG: hypothetical protein AAF628_34390 [Planctomycetota bacterium]
MHLDLPTPRCRTILLILAVVAPGGPAQVSWEQVIPAGMAPRRNHAVAYDSVRDRLVVFGGRVEYSRQEVDETWEWDGVEWSERTPLARPGERHAAAMTFDEARGVAVLFGGFSAGALGDTWEWDGTNWTERFPEHSPDAGAWFSMAYDTRRRRAVLFDGRALWAWDGTDWQPLPTAESPPGRSHPRIAYDDQRDRLVLFGGQDSLGTRNDTWEWDGSTWGERIPATVAAGSTSSSRSISALPAYDPASI